MNTDPSTGADSESNFDQAVIARLHTTNPDIARWVENTLCEEQTLATIIDTDGYALDPADDAAVELIATAIELWIIEVGGELPMVSVAGRGSENSP